ncbi:carbohydrate ABC transporter permease, partial [Streptomyces sp. TRM76130]|nr:carbohydrate ABC transporter permease [Streptomyces sp. TRM76130]
MTRTARTARTTPMMRTVRRAVARALTYLSLAVATLVVLLPLTVVLLTSLKTSGEMADGSGALAL